MVDKIKEKRKVRENNINPFPVDEDLGSVISSSEDEVLLGSYSPAVDDNDRDLPKESHQPPPLDDDRMSLSPLSSGDEKIEEVDSVFNSTWTDLLTSVRILYKD